MSKLNRMEELYRSYNNKDTPIAKSLKKIIDENKRNKPTKSAAKKGGSLTQKEQTLKELKYEKEKFKNIIAELQQDDNNNTETDSTEPGTPASSVSSGLNSPKNKKQNQKNQKKNQKNTHVKQTTKGNAGRHAKSVNAYVTRSRALIGKEGEKQRKKHKRKLKKIIY